MLIRHGGTAIVRMLDGGGAMNTDLEAGEDLMPDRRRWLRKVDDDTAFAYARGHDFVRGRDNALWAHLSNGWLLSARSGDPLAYQVGHVFYDAASGAAVYYEPG
jgi:hypothetical protein